MSIKQNIETVRENIEKACIRSGRNREDVLLIGVTKYVDTERIQEALDAGITDVGENHAQEVREKLSFFKQNGCSVHFIGQLQTNKIKYVCGQVVLIQSVDRFDLAEQINKKASSCDVIQDILLQVNIGDESQKGGVPEAETMGLVEQIAGMDHIRMRGLMCVPPAMEPEMVRPFFAEMKRLTEKVRAEFPELPVTELSMGMSHDYSVAVEEGATMVRVGSAIFGARDRK